MHRLAMHRPPRLLTARTLGSVQHPRFAIRDSWRFPPGLSDQRRGNSIQAIDPIREDVDSVTLDDFLRHKQHDVPLVLSPGSSGNGPVPRAIAKWFNFKSESGRVHPYASPYLKDLGHTPVAYEWNITPSVERFISLLQAGDLRSLLVTHIADNAASESYPQFLRFTAPLDLFLAALQYNNSQSSPADKLTSLYIAQSSVSGLPQALQGDLAPPPVISIGSIYDSSIWLGLTPTYTPLHRDPNPNLFRQLHGSKVVRILPPRAGEGVFRRIQSSIGGSASPRLRGQEMMHGPERTALHDAIWGRGEHGAGRTVYEAKLRAGDALYLPEGWWHSIKSAAADADPGLPQDGQLNVSVNWWFRPPTTAK